jgi:hypothetical protein
MPAIIKRMMCFYGKIREFKVIVAKNRQNSVVGWLNQSFNLILPKNFVV